MNLDRTKHWLVATMACFLWASAAHGETAPKMTMTTDIPETISTPDTVETKRLGTLEFVDGFPTDETTRKV